MKKTILLIMAVISTAILFSACSIEKRHYRPGYHVEWHYKGSTVSQTSPKSEEETVQYKEQKQVPAVKPGEIELYDVSGLTLQPEKKQTETAQAIERNTLPHKTAQAHAKIPNGKKLEKVLASSKISRVFKSPKVSDTALSDDGRLIIGIILLIFGLSPFAVLVYNGAGPEFSLDFLLWILGLVFLVIGFAVGSPGLAAVGWILLLAAFIYAIIAMIRRAV